MTFSFATLLKECNEVTIHIKNLHTLLREVYKYINRLSPPLMQELFESRTLYYNLRNFRAIQTYRKNMIAFGIETVTYKSSQLWQILPTELKSIESLREFKRKVKEWNGKKLRLLIMQNIYQKFRIFRMNINVDTGTKIRKTCFKLFVLFQRVSKIYLCLF